MTKSAYRILTALLLFAGSTITHAAEFSTGLSAGYGKGVTVQANFAGSSFARGFPLGFDFSIGYSGVAAGQPEQARRVFVNEADNGTPESSAALWTFRLDLLYKVNLAGPRATFLYVGFRRTYFDATFRYVGANEEFDVTSSQWGFGIGTKAAFEISNRLDLNLSVGIDAFLPGPLHGHDSTYNPDNENVNSKENFTYTDASKVIYTPKFAPIVTFGFSYNL